MSMWVTEGRGGEKLATYWKPIWHLGSPRPAFLKLQNLEVFQEKNFQ